MKSARRECAGPCHVGGVAARQPVLRVLLRVVALRFAPPRDALLARALVLEPFFAMAILSAPEGRCAAARSGR